MVQTPAQIVFRLSPRREKPGVERPVIDMHDDLIRQHLHIDGAERAFRDAGLDALADDAGGSFLEPLEFLDLIPRKRFRLADTEDRRLPVFNVDAMIMP